MYQDFKHFLRHGGNDEYVLQQRNGQTFGRSLSLKSRFPSYGQFRQDFRRRLEAEAADNVRMILSALTMPDTPPLYSEADLLPASEIIDQVLQHWDNRLEDIYARYQNHSQRLRPLRESMEDRTTLSFAGLINQLRQEDLGIEGYVWTTQGDHKVRPSHAALEGEVFRWDHPPGEGHPGQTPNCRCRAVPVLNASPEAILANFALPANAISNLPPSALREALRQLAARTPAGAVVLAAMEAAEGLNQLVEVLRHARLEHASERLGLDLQSIEGILAASAYGLVYETALTGFAFGVPKTVEAAQIAGQAAALYELLAPGTVLKVQQGERGMRRKIFRS